MADKINLTDLLKELEAIADWFDIQQDVDIEVGLTKVKQAAKLIKSSKARLAEIENEFEQIEKEIADDTENVHVSEIMVSEVITDDTDSSSLSEVLF